MASRKGISYQWRLFLPVVLTFWLVILGMGWWQTVRVSELNRRVVDDQLQLIGERLADLYNNEQQGYALTYIKFVNKYYQKMSRYEEMSIQVRDSLGNTVLNVGSTVPDDYALPNDSVPRGIFVYGGGNVHSTHDDLPFVYYTTSTKDGEDIWVMLPFTKELSRRISSTTTKFWLIFFCIAVFVTIFAYISSAYITRNVRILRDFANMAAKNPKLVTTDYKFPHDELGDISRQILNIYNQRTLEMERREKEHRIALNAIEEKERIKRELTGNINHELKTPVGVIQGYIDTLASDPDMDPALREKFLKKTQESVHRLTSLIADITVITKLESDGKLVNIEEVNFHDLVFTFDNFLHEADVLPDNMEFTYDIPLNCLVLGNEGLLSTVLLNLVKNAAKYSHGTVCHLEYAGEEGDFHKFTFYDNGVGVPPEHLEHLFERFYRVNAGRGRDSGGTGLGLSIIKVTIKSFGGNIEVCNRHPSGLEYHFTLPKFTRKNKTVPKQ